jgi:hypothetical protein
VVLRIDAIFVLSAVFDMNPMWMLFSKWHASYGPVFDKPFQKLSYMYMVPTVHRTFKRYIILPLDS